ncbi:hypothetical protein CDAR_174321 [Caerostris darwini]|uniref:Uncharacterized protein n=1 Tax=Caerostris darwini TaxID=1538125 RepID=A0AAV4VIT5_9ARAC|nr:hypothetical protein CDAR_174321 [Caerostris darwini]
MLPSEEVPALPIEFQKILQTTVCRNFLKHSRCLLSNLFIPAMLPHLSGRQLVFNLNPQTAFTASGGHVYSEGTQDASIQSLYPCYAAPSNWKTAGVHLKPPKQPHKPPLLHPGVTLIQKGGIFRESSGLTLDCPPNRIRAPPLLAIKKDRTTSWVMLLPRKSLPSGGF